MSNNIIKEIINILEINKEDENNKKNKEKEEENALKSKSVKQNFMSLYNLSDKNVNKKHKLKNNKKQKKVLDLDHVNYQTLNIQELNNLQYEIAILIDKRTFFQYYVALIRKKQLIIWGIWYLKSSSPLFVYIWCIVVSEKKSAFIVINKENCNKKDDILSVNKL